MILQVSPSPPPKKRTPEVKKRSRSWRCCCCLTPRSTVQSLARKEGKSIDQKKMVEGGEPCSRFFCCSCTKCLLDFFQLLFLWVVQRCLHQGRNIDDMHTDTYDIFKTHETARVCWKCLCLLMFTYSNFLP